MDLKYFLGVALLISVIACQVNTNNETNTQKPNILLIIADDLGYEKLGSYGGIDTRTPNIDKLAAKGIQFNNAYTSPVCTPSRMSIYTGRYATYHQYTHVLPVHEGTKEAVDFGQFTTFAHLFKKQGYLTSVTGKWQLAALEYHPEHCRTAGFDSWCVWQIWKDNKKTTRYWEATLNEDGEIRDDIQTQFGSDVLTDYVIEQMQEAKAANKSFLIHHNMMLPHYPIIQTPEDKRLNREASLDNLISYMDIQVGKLLDTVDAMGIAENTIVIFAGDNGTETKETRLTQKGKVTGGKHTMTDAGAHVPLIVYQLGKIAGGKKIEHLIDFADLFPTLCDLAEINIPDLVSTDGISFHPLLQGEETPTRNYVTAGYRGKYMIFDGNWRWHINDEELFDCRNLPKEVLADLQTEEAQVVKEKLNNTLDSLLKAGQ